MPIAEDPADIGVSQPDTSQPYTPTKAELTDFMSPYYDDRYAAIQEYRTFMDQLAIELAKPSTGTKTVKEPIVVKEPIIREKDSSTNPTVPATPPSPPPPPPPPPPLIIKTGTPQYVLFNDEEVPLELITDLLFENIGGQELLTISRFDTVNGKKIAYQPIKNLGILNEEYNPNNLIKLQNTSDKFFANYTIKLAERIPVVGNGPNGDNVYLDGSGNLVIEFVNLNLDEQVEVQITLNGTIYEVGI